jgi:hypothetical protein
MEKLSLKRYPGLFTIVWLLIVYTLVYLYEKALARLIHFEIVSAQLPPYWRIDLASAFGPLLILLVIAALAWFVLSYLPPTLIGSCFLLFSGLLFIVLRFYHYLILISEDIFFPAWLHSSTALGRFRLSFMNFGMLGYFPLIYYLGSGAILIGIASLWRCRVQNRDST